MANTDKNPVLQQFDGEFAIPADAPAQQPDDKKPAEKQEEPKKFRREIDLGDGSGKQVFEADSMEALVDELTKAQENATRKIREQNKALKRARRKPAPVVQADPAQSDVKPLTPDEEFMLGQQFSQNPTKTFERLFEAQTGYKLSEFKSKVAAMEAFQEAQAATAAAQEFLNDHEDDYLPTPANYRALQEYLEEHNLPMNRETLEEAFDEVRQVGFPDEATSQEEKPDEKERIADSQPERKTKVSSGLSDRGSRREPVEQPGRAALSDEDIWSLPLEQARDRIVRSLRSGSAAGSR